MGWPTGEDTRNWMRAQAVGDDAIDLAKLDDTTRAATEVLSARLDPDLLEAAGSVTSLALAGNVGTAVTSAAHGIGPGVTVTLAGADPVLFDGEFVVLSSGLGRRTFSFALVGADVDPAVAQSAATFLTVDRCPEAVATAIMIRAANYFIRRDAAAGIIRIAPDQAIRINRYDSDVDELLGPYLWGPDPAPGD